MKKTKDIYKEVKAYIEKYRMISAGDTVLAGVSGGADSVCMLHMMGKLREEISFRLMAAHIHHGVREDAQKDADYVEALCREWEIPFFLKKVDMDGYAKEKGLSPEEAGRELRYQAFEEVFREVEEADKGACKIAVAHNRNDRAETMLFHLFRGSGLRGLGSIRPVRGKIIRPLLCLGREEIETYLSENGIAFCLDSTNAEDSYTRNKIRHHILSYAEEHICSNAAAHIADAAEILAETEDFVRKQTDFACSRCICAGEKEEAALNLTAFRGEEPFLQRRILLQYMERMTPYRKDITKEHIDALMRLVQKDGSGEIFLPYGLYAYKEYDRLLLKKAVKEGAVHGKKEEQEEECPPFTVTVPGEIEVPGLGEISFQYVPEEEFFYKKEQNIPEKTYTKWFDYDKITTALVFRTRKTGDYLTIDNALRKKTVKEYMINEKIPKMQRERIYMLADGSHILWIPGYRISQYYKVNENTKRILQVQLKEESNG